MSKRVRSQADVVGAGGGIVGMMPILSHDTFDVTYSHPHELTADGRLQNITFQQLRLRAVDMLKNSHKNPDFYKWPVKAQFPDATDSLIT